MSVKFPHIHLYPKNKQEMNDPEFMRNLAIRKMAGVRDNGDEAATSQDRKDLLIALSREPDKEKWVGIISTFCVVHLIWEEKVNGVDKVKTVSTATKSATDKRVDNLARARAIKAKMTAEGKLLANGMKVGVDYGKKGQDTGEGEPDAD